MFSSVQLRSHRLAFTLVELLVVITIIIILVSLTAAGVSRMVDASRTRTTETIVQAVDQLLQKAWNKVIADAKKEPIPQGVLNFAMDPKRARVIWIKLRLMEAFPQTYQEILNPPIYNPSVNSTVFAADNGPIPPGMRRYLRTYQNILTAKGITNDNGGRAHSSACLLMALSEINRGGGASLRPDQFRIGDTDGDGLPEFLDGWGNPLFFARFATGDGGGLQSAFPTTDPKMSQYRDPLDPDGWLARPWRWQQGNGGYGYVNLKQITFIGQPPNGWPPPYWIIHPIYPSGATAPPTNYVIPVVFSAGRDGYPGVDVFLNITNPAQEQDNIYSFNLKLGRSD
jgi:type II secretory pathway pseudopilin PulG